MATLPPGPTITACTMENFIADWRHKLVSVHTTVTELMQTLDLLERGHLKLIRRIERSGHRVLEEMHQQSTSWEQQPQEDVQVFAHIGEPDVCLEEAESYVSPAGPAKQHQPQYGHEQQHHHHDPQHQHIVHATHPLQQQHRFQSDRQIENIDPAGDSEDGLVVARRIPDTPVRKTTVLTQMAKAELITGDTQVVTTAVESLSAGDETPASTPDQLTHVALHRQNKLEAKKEEEAAVAAAAAAYAAASHHVHALPSIKCTRWPCDRCSYIATRRSDLRKHQAAVHDGKRYPCDECDYQATQPNSLKVHKLAKHSGVTFPCDQCEYKAAQKGSLRNHKRSMHDGERYPCDQCGFVAKWLKILKLHKKSKHPSDSEITFIG